MAARLKVFVTSDGLTDYVVATSSKPKALAAWGSHQDLFKTGLAHETDDPELVKAASAQPGEVLRRPAGTRGALERLRPARKPSAKRTAPSQSALKKVADLERRLTQLDARQRLSLEKLEAQRRALEERREALEAGHAEERARYEAALTAARRALE